MTFNQTTLSLCLALAALSACGESQQQLIHAQNMTCTELARELGKREERRDSAQIDGFVDTLVSVTAEDQALRQSADIDAAVNLFDEIDAEQSLEQLTQIYRANGCT